MKYNNLISENSKKPIFRKNANFIEKQLSKLGCHGNINIDINVTTTFKCSQINFR